MTQIVTFTPNPAVDVSTSVERIVPVSKLRCSPQRRDPGGGGINVARVVKRFGGDVMAIFLYGGATGRLLQQLVKREEIPTLASEIAEETREDFSVDEESTGKQYRFVLPGPTLSDAEWRAGLDTLAAAAGLCACHVQGMAEVAACTSIRIKSRQRQPISLDEACDRSRRVGGGNHLRAAGRQAGVPPRCQGERRLPIQRGSERTCNVAKGGRGCPERERRSTEAFQPGARLPWQPVREPPRSGRS